MPRMPGGEGGEARGRLSLEKLIQDQKEKGKWGNGELPDCMSTTDLPAALDGVDSCRDESVKRTGSASDCGLGSPSSSLPSARSRREDSWAPGAVAQAAGDETALAGGVTGLALAGTRAGASLASPSRRVSSSLPASTSKSYTLQRGSAHR